MGYQARQTFVLNKITRLAREMEGHKAKLGLLFIEAKEGHYYRNWGYTNFGKWINESGLGISAREIYYYMRIATKASSMGISPTILDELPVSHLKHIFVLDPRKNTGQIKSLISSSRKGATLEQVKSAVRDVAHLPAQIVYSANFRSVESKETVARTVAAIRKAHPEFKYIGDALEFICREYAKLQAIHTLNNSSNVRRRRIAA